jgi:hypothetical protein
MKQPPHAPKLEGRQISSLYLFRYSRREPFRRLAGGGDKGGCSQREHRRAAQETTPGTLPGRSPGSESPWRRLRAGRRAGLRDGLIYCCRPRCLAFCRTRSAKIRTAKKNGVA